MSSPSDRILRSIVGLIRETFPNLAYAGVYEYRVVAQTDSTYDLQVAQAASGMPDLGRVPLRPGAAGYRSTLKPGTSVIVSFINSDPARPFISAVNPEDKEDAAHYPDATSIDATNTVTFQHGTLPVARQTDAVDMGWLWIVTTGGNYTSAIWSPISVVPNPLTAGPVVTTAIPLGPGSITGGNPKVKA